MELIGMLDSPYVRRVAITFQVLGIEFTHRSLSVFKEYEAFCKLNPVVKAPSLICDNGAILTDSNLIIDYGISLAGSKHRLLPEDIVERQHSLELIGLALIVCEKSIQIVYEHNLRPEEKRHTPWINRVTEQLMASLTLLEEKVNVQSDTMTSKHLDLALITTAVAWKFIQEMLPDIVDARRFKQLASLSDKAEQLPEFKSAPYGDLNYPIQP